VTGPEYRWPLVPWVVTATARLEAAKDYCPKYAAFFAAKSAFSAGSSSIG
jgi:hypothetical protein